MPESLFILCRALCSALRCGSDMVDEYQPESFSLEGCAIFPRSFARILHPRKASATAKSLSFTYRAHTREDERKRKRREKVYPRPSRGHFSMRIRRYSNNLLPLVRLDNYPDDGSRADNLFRTFFSCVSTLLFFAYRAISLRQAHSHRMKGKRGSTQRVRMYIDLCHIIFSS